MSIKYIDELYLQEIAVSEIAPRRSQKRYIFYSTVCLLFLILVFVRAPSEFSEKSLIRIEKDSTISGVALQLKESGAVKSAFLFKSFVVLFNSKNGVLAGEYYFEEPSNLVTVAYRMSNGQFGLTPVKFTVPEGTNAFQLADIAKSIFPNIDKEEILSLAKQNEGFLFPDTYYLLPNAVPKDLVDSMKTNFDHKLKDLSSEIEKFGKPIEDIIIMASLLEEEARISETRRTIAGILWNRISLGMALQVDSTFQYINGKNTYELTLDDLKNKSPYNTYVHTGLTPTAISNPGIEAIKAAVTPIETNFLYFLSDKNGTMHYAVTHDEHVANKDRYLR